MEHNTTNFDALVHRYLQVMESFHNQMEAAVVHLKETVGLSPHQVHILQLLKKKNEMRSTEVAKAIGLTPGAITAITNELVEKNLVDRLRTEYDRRVVLLRLTDEGDQTLTKVTNFQVGRIRKTLELLGDSDAVLFIELLEKISEQRFIPITRSDKNES
jgi:DNA-binding MarR family transcriptional regulator